MKRLVLEKVFFKIKIEDVFSIVGRDIVVISGRVICGEIHDKSNVVITDDTGLILKKTKVKDLQWFGRSREKHVTVGEGRNIAIEFDAVDKEYLQINHYIVIK